MATEQLPRWRITRYRPFELRSPDGDLVKLGYAKVEELLTVLSTAPKNTLQREQLANYLWPGADETAKQVNLRQAIYRLRRAIGPESVETDGESCWLSQSFSVLVAESPPPSRYVSSEVPGLRDASSPLHGFVQTLRWFAEYDPAKMLDLMKCSLDLTIGIPPKELKVLVDTAAPRLPLNHPMIGWMPFYRGLAGLDSDSIVEGRRLFNAAYQSGSMHKDHELMIESIFWASASEILLGRTDRAERLVLKGEHMANELHSKIFMGKMAHVRGTILIHQARTKEGLEVLKQANEAYARSILDHAQNEALCALYLACAGDPYGSLKVLEAPLRLSKETSHFRLECICELAVAYIHLRAGENLSAPAMLTGMADHFNRTDGAHFEIYAREAAAVALWNQGEKAEALEEIKETKRLRAVLDMAYTDWDRLRLQPVQNPNGSDYARIA